MRFWKRRSIRRFTSCAVDGERVTASGEGDAKPMDRFVIAANGRRIEMVVLHVQWGFSHSGVQWTAQDYESWFRSHRVMP